MREGYGQETPRQLESRAAHPNTNPIFMTPLPFRQTETVNLTLKPGLFGVCLMTDRKK